MRKGQALNRAISTTEGTTPPSASAREQRSPRLGEVAPNPVNPRRSVDPDALNSLTASIREFGQLQPVLAVTRDAFLAIMQDHADTIGDAGYVVVGGSQRLAALHEIGGQTIAIEVDDTVASNRARFVMAALSENVQRADLTPMDEAYTVQQMVGEMSKSEVARQLGKKPGWVTHRLALLNLSDAMVTELEAGRLRLTDARRLGSKVDPEQQYATWQAEQDEFLHRKNQPASDEQPDGEPAGPTPEVLHRKNPDEPNGHAADAGEGDGEAAADFLHRKNQPSSPPPEPDQPVDSSAIQEPDPEPDPEPDRAGPKRVQPYRPKTASDGEGISRREIADELARVLATFPAGEETVAAVTDALIWSLDGSDFAAVGQRITARSGG